jgi:hypothetical protein
MNKIINFLLWPWYKWAEHRKFKKRIKELREKDPFIYK